MTRSRYFTDSHSGDGAVHYRYHALFRELLLQHAEQAFTPAQRQELMQRSAQLLEQDVELEAALALYQDAGDWPSAAQLILTQAGTLFGQGRWQTLQGWLRRMPGEAIEASPWLEFWIGACRAQTDPPAGRAIVEAVHRRFVDADDLVGQALSACAVIESYSVDWGDFTRINPWIAILQGILATEPRFPALAIELRVWSGLLMAMAQCQPQHALGPEAADRVWQLCRADIDPAARLLAATNLVYFLAFNQPIARARAAVREFSHLADAPRATPLQRIIWCQTQGIFHGWEFNFEASSTLWRQARLVAEEHGLHFIVSMCELVEIWGLIGADRFDEAAAALRQIESDIDRARPSDLSLYHLVRSWLALLQQQPRHGLMHSEAAVDLMRPIGGVVRLVSGLTTYSQALAECGELERALAVAQEVSALFTEPSDGIMHFTALLHEADVLQRLERRAESEHLLAQALAMGRRGGYVTSVHWLPQMMSRLAAAALRAGIESEYVEQLIRMRGLAMRSTSRCIDCASCWATTSSCAWTRAASVSTSSAPGSTPGRSNACVLRWTNGVRRRSHQSTKSLPRSLLACSACTARTSSRARMQRGHSLPASACAASSCAACRRSASGWSRAGTITRPACSISAASRPRRWRKSFIVALCVHTVRKAAWPRRWTPIAAATSCSAAHSAPSPHQQRRRSTAS